MIHRFHRFHRFAWQCICALCVICGPAFSQTGTTVTGTTKTSDQLTPLAAGLVKYGTQVAGNDVYGRIEFRACATDSTGQRCVSYPQVSCGGPGYLGTSIAYIKGDGVWIDPAGGTGAKRVPNAGCTPTGLATEAKISLNAGCRPGSSGCTAVLQRPAVTVTEVKVIPDQASVDWYAIALAAAATPAASYQTQSRGDVLDSEGFTCVDPATVPAPAAGVVEYFCDSTDSNLLKRKNFGGTVTLVEGGGGGGSGDITRVGDCLTGDCYASVAINLVYAGPASGGAGQATMRALVEADIPALAQSKITNLVTDLAGKQPLDADLTALAALGTTGYAKRTGADAWSLVATIPETDLDAALARDSEVAAAYLVLAGGTMTGTLTARAGATGAGTAPFKFQAGSLMTTPEAHAFEWDGALLYVTQATGPTRKTLAFTDSNITGNATTATALAADPADCSANQFANAIAASGALTCAQVNFTQLAGQIAVGQFPDAVVTYAKIQNVSATDRILGRDTAGAGVIEELTPTAVTALLDAMVGDSGAGGTKGLAPAPAAGDAAAGKFLKADGTWAVPAGGGTGCTPGGSNNQILTDSGAGGCVPEANFTFDGTLATITGNLSVSGFLSFGTDPAEAGTIRLPNSAVWQWEASPASAVEGRFFYDANEMYRWDWSATTYLTLENPAAGATIIWKLNPASSEGQMTFQAWSLRDGLLDSGGATGRSTKGGDLVGTVFTYANSAESSTCIGKFDTAGNCPTSGNADLLVWDERAAGITLAKIKGGASQGANNLLEFEASGGATLLTVDSGGGLNSTLGTITASNPHLSGTATLNNAGIAFMGLDFNWTLTAAHSGSRFFRYQIAGVTATEIIASTGGLTLTSDSQQNMLQLLATAPGVAGTRDSPAMIHRGASFDTGAHTADWRWLVDVTSNAGASTYRLATRIDAASFADALTISDAGVIGTATFNASSGFQVGGAALNFSHLAGSIALAQTPLTTEGDLLFANGTPALARLARGANGECLTATATTIAWGSCSGSSGAPAGAQYLVLALDATLTAERRLVGTTNKITLTDGGANGDLTLATGSLVVHTDQSNTYSTGTQDFTAVTAMLVKSAAGYAPTADASFGYDTTGDKFVGGGLGAITGSFLRVLSITRPGESKTNSVTSDQDYASVFTIPANYLDSGRCLRITLGFQAVMGTSSATWQRYLKIGGTKVYTGVVVNAPDGNTRSGAMVFNVCGTAAPGASVNVDTFVVYGSGSAIGNDFNNTTQPIALATNGALAVVFGITFGATGSTETLELRQAVVEEVLTP